MRGLFGRLLLSLATLAASPRASAEELPPGEAAAPRLTKAPELVRFVEAEYPEEARLAGRTAEVLLALDLDESGKVTRAAVTSPKNPGFDEAALAAAKLLEFTPAEVDGKPAAVRISFRYRFALEAAPEPEPEPAPAPRERTAIADEARPEPRAQSDAVDEEIVVRSRQTRPGGATALDRNRARKVPGVMGDALNVVQNLPGVGSAPGMSGELVVWGAMPAETRVFIDEVPVPALYHQGGFRSVLHDGLVQEIELVPAGFGPEYGGAIGGIVRVSTRPLERDGVHGEVAADLIGAGALLSTRPEPSVAAAGGARVGYLEQWLSAVSEDVEWVVPISAYRDYAAKARIGDERAAGELLIFGSYDDVERRLPSTDPALTHGEQRRDSFHRAALRFEAFPGGGIADRATLWAGVDESELAANFAGVGTRLSARSYRAGVRASRRFAFASSTLLLGLDAEGHHTRVEREGTLGLPAREGDVRAFGQAPAGQVAEDRWTVDLVQVAAYVQGDARLAGGLLVLSPGLRFEPIVQSGDRAVPTTGGGAPIGYSKLDIAVAPRLSAKLFPHEAFELVAATGLYHQPPAATDASPVFGGTKLDLQRAAHGLVGATYRPWSRTSLESAVFARYGWDLVSRSASEPPQVARALVNEGRGRAYGAQLVLRQELMAGLSGWLSYALSRSERKDAPGRGFRLSDYDQTHLITAVASYELDEHWTLGTRLRAASGLPRTEVTGSYYDARLDRFQPIFAAANGTRLAPSFQLDLRAEYTHDLDGARLVAYLDLLNVTNQENPVEIVYNADYSERAYLTSLPALAILGGRVEF